MILYAMKIESVKSDHIRESVDSLCRDGADAQYMQYLSKSCITSCVCKLSQQLYKLQSEMSLLSPVHKPRNKAI